MSLDALLGLPGCVPLHIWRSAMRARLWTTAVCSILLPFTLAGLEDKQGIINLNTVLMDHFQLGTRLEIHTYAGHPHGFAGMSIIDGKGRPDFDSWVKHADVFMQDTYANYQ